MPDASAASAPPEVTTRIALGPHALPPAGVRLSVAAPVLMKLALSESRAPAKGVLDNAMLLATVYALDDPPVVSVPLLSFSHPAMPAIIARALLLTVPGNWPSIHDTSGSMLSLLAAVVDHRYGLPAICSLAP